MEKHITKKALSILLSFIFIISTFSAGAIEAQASGVDGFTAIYTDDDLYNIRNNPNGKYYLANDIVFESSYFIMHGKYYNYGTFFNAFEKFAGVIDGCGHSIIGLKGNYAIAYSNVGIIKNLKTENCNLDAGFCYNNSGTIENCYIENTSVTYGLTAVNSTGGTLRYCFSSESNAPITGENYGTIDGCTNYSDIISSTDCSGISTYNDGGTIKNSVNYGNITSTGKYASGITSSLSDYVYSTGKIISCANYGSVTSNAGCAAGISYNYSYHSLTDCLNYGTITSNGNNSYSYSCGLGYQCSSLQGCVNFGSTVSSTNHNYAVGYDISPSNISAVYYLSDSGKLLSDHSSRCAAVTALNKSQENSYPLLDFSNVWQISNDAVTLQITNKKQIETSLYSVPEKVYYNIGEKLDLSGIIVMTFDNQGNWLIDEDYTVSGFTGKIGKNIIQITAKGYSTAYNVYVRDIMSNKKIILNQTSYVYTGAAAKPAVTVIDASGKKLRLNTDYTISYFNNVNPGMATVTITGKGNYTGSVKKAFIIKPKKTTSFKVSARNTTGLKLTWAKQTGVTGYVVQKYDIKKKNWNTYKTITSNTNSITISKLSPATTYKFRVKSYKTINNTKYYGEYSSVLNTPTKPKNATKLKVKHSYQKKGNKECFKTTWNKTSGATGYQLYYICEGNVKKTINVKNVSTYTLKVSARDYQPLKVKIRAYKTVDGKKYYGEWSSYVKIKF